MGIVVLTDARSYEHGTKKLREYLKKKNIDSDAPNVLYLPFDRKITVSKYDIEKFNLPEYIIMGKLMGEKFTTRKEVETVFDIKDPFCWEYWELGKEITCGYEQILNTIFSILSSENKEILIIDHFEKNLHPLTAMYFLHCLEFYTNVQKDFKDIIITLYQPYLLEGCKDNIYE